MLKPQGNKRAQPVVTQEKSALRHVSGMEVENHVFGVSKPRCTARSAFVKAWHVAAWFGTVLTIQ
jgi:hypothetical protein